ncbi:MAG: ATP-binding cassette domain-containing protein [Cellvibrionaceae bacterium]
MIQLQNVSVHRGTKQLLAETDLTINPREKVGLVGANGCGKSTLFQLLLSNISADGGECHIPKHWRIGYMRQEIVDNEQSALDFVIDGDEQLRLVQKQINDKSGSDEQLAQLYTRLEELDGYTAESRAATLLSGLGFSNNDIQNSVGSFSGGWRVRLALAQALMSPSDLLLLDEPTNHLDLGATIWLEQWLRRYSGTLMIVSHDRDFLDHVITTIVHIEREKLVRYQGHYSSFEKQRAERMAQQQQHFEKQQERVGEIQDFVRRFRAKASKAKQAQSRLKELQRMELLEPAHSESPFNFVIPNADKIPQNLMSLADATIGYNDDTCLPNINFTLYDSSRIGLLGMNGAGKSTLLKTLAGDLPVLAGERLVNDNTAIGYFAQHQVNSLDLNATAFVHVQRLSPKATEQSVRNFLGGFDFQGDRIFEDVKKFSGGEKARLTIALIAWQKPNVLILDEPTNHLDMEMRHALTIALQAFEGAIIVVSHDRHLLRNSADELLLVSNQKITPYNDDLDEYENWLLNQSAQPSNISSVNNSAEEPENSSASKKEQRQQAAQNRNQLKPLTNKIKKLEAQLEKLQKQQSDLEEKLADTTLYEDSNKDKLQALLKEQATINQALESTEEEWLEKQEELEIAMNND